MKNLPTFEETLEKQKFEAGDNQTFDKNGFIIVNELWLRNFHKLAQTKKPLNISKQRHT